MGEQKKKKNWEKGRDNKTEKEGSPPRHCRQRNGKSTDSIHACEKKARKKSEEKHGGIKRH